MIKIGITGGIGSGKSYVSHLLEEAGIPVYDTDTEAKKLTLSHPRIREGLLVLLGEDVYKADGSLNKPVLANYLFASTENAGRVNRIIILVCMKTSNSGQTVRPHPERRW